MNLAILAKVMIVAAKTKDLAERKRVVYTSCLICGSACGLKVTLEDGEIVDIGEYTITNNVFILTYDPPPPCSELQCVFRFNYTLTENTLILTSPELGTSRYRLID